MSVGRPLKATKQMWQVSYLTLPETKYGWEGIWWEPSDGNLESKDAEMRLLRSREGKREDAVSL